MSQVAGAFALPPHSSPFLTITAPWRYALLAYLALYHCLFPAITAMGESFPGDLLPLRVLLNTIYVMMLGLPLMFYRREYGWLHPLILPTVLILMKLVVKFPLHLVMPFDIPVVDFTVASTSRAISLARGEEELALLRTFYLVMKIAALGLYYFAFHRIPLFRTPNIEFAAPRNPTLVCGVALAVCAVVSFAYLFSMGGVSSYLVAMRGGRTALFAGQGQFRVLAEFAPTIVLVWFVYLKRPFLSPLWIAGLAAGIMLPLLLSGSRSSAIYFLVTLMLLWWRKSNRVMPAAAAVFGLIAVLIFGIFGSIRQDYGSRQIDTSVFAATNFMQQASNAAIEFEERAAQESDFAAFAGAVDGPLLLGRTYAGSMLFWLPRAVWSEKPRSADTYNMWVNYAGRSLQDSFSTGRQWGIPVGPVSEAFWNFHIPGVILFALLFGAFHRWLADLVVRYPSVPAALVFAMHAMVGFVGTSLTFTTTLRSALLLIGLLVLMGVIRMPRRGLALRRASSAMGAAKS